MGIRDTRVMAVNVTFDDILDKFTNTFPSAVIDDYRPICHELFTNGKSGITVWLDNGDVVEYYPNLEEY